MYYSGSETNEYSNAMVGFAALYVFTALLLIVALTFFVIARVKTTRKRLFYILSTIALAMTIVFGIMAFTQSKPRCCGEGITRQGSSYVASLT